VGHDISQLGKHNLKTDSIESLAFDLSKRLKVNVEFGYQNSFIFQNETIQHADNNAIVKIGKINYKRVRKTIFLKDEFYQIHQILEKIGNNIFDMSFTSENSINENELKSAIDNTFYNIYNPDEDTIFGSINNDIFNYESIYYDRWLAFCNLFTDKEVWNENSNKLKQYRKQLKEFYQLIGGSAVIYLNDQGEMQYLLDDFNTWDVILNELKTNFKQITLNVSNFINQVDFTPLQANPHAFYDDFKDI